MRWQIAALTVLAGCAGQQQFSSPAPASSLECAIGEAEEMGYRRLSSSRRMGVRLGKYVPDDPAREQRDRMSPTGTDRDLGNDVLRGDDGGPLESQFRVWHDRGQLRFEILSEREGPSVETQVTGDASEDAQKILALCGGPAPA